MSIWRHPSGVTIDESNKDWFLAESKLAIEMYDSFLEDGYIRDTRGDELERAYEQYKFMSEVPMTVEIYEEVILDYIDELNEV